MIHISYLEKDSHTGENVRKDIMCKEGEKIDAVKDNLKAAGAKAIRINVTDSYKGRHIDARC